MTAVIEMPAAVEQPKPTVVQAGSCPGCGRMAEENDLGFAPPITLQLRSCGHYSCASCSRICADEGCSHESCTDCCNTCEGCADNHCPEHTVAKCYCKECAPPDVLREHNRPAYCFED